MLSLFTRDAACVFTAYIAFVATASFVRFVLVLAIRTSFRNFGMRLWAVARHRANSKARTVLSLCAVARTRRFATLLPMPARHSTHCVGLSARHFISLSTSTSDADLTATAHVCRYPHLHQSLMRKKQHFRGKKMHFPIFRR